MPFFDDSGARPEDERGPLGRALALARDQLERLMVLNLAWSAQTVPLLAAWAFPQWPLVVRGALALYSAFALIPASAALFAVVNQVSEGAPLSLELALSELKAHFAASLLKLLPLYSVFYWLALLAGWAAERGLVALDVAARLALLLAAVGALYWGPLIVMEPALSVAQIVARSARCFWRQPAPTLWVGLACGLALVLGVISIAGFFLIVPVLIALMQVELYRSSLIHEATRSDAKKV